MRAVVGSPILPCLVIAVEPGWGSVTKGAMGSLMVVMLPPTLDVVPGVPSIEDLRVVQTFVTEHPMEALNGAVLVPDPFS